MKKRILTTLVCTLIGAPSVSAAPISFQQAWELLQQNNHSLAAERANVARYEYLQNATDSLNYPSVTVGANYTRLDKDITLSGKQLADHTTLPANLAGLAPVFQGLAQALNLGEIETKITDRDIFSSSIRAIWPIFTGGRITAAQTAAEGRKEEAASHMAMETQARYEDLSKYYFSVLLAKDVLATREAVVDGLTRHRNNAVKLENQGQIAHVERLQAEASLDKAIVESKKARKSLEIASTALTQILSQTTEVEPGGTLFINRSLPPLSAFLEQTLNTYPGLSLLDAALLRNSVIKRNCLDLSDSYTTY